MENLESKLTRREFLQSFKKTAIGAGSAILIATIFDRHNRPNVDLRIPGRVVQDLLTQEELIENHITIYHPSNVNLYLRRQVFDIFPVFKDARDKKINGVVITLVDHPFLSWNSSSVLPQAARLAYQATHESPREIPDAYWQRVLSFWQDQKEEFSKSLHFFESNPSAEELKRRRVGLQGTIEEAIQIDRRAIAHTEQMIELVRDKDKIVAYLSEHGTIGIPLMRPPIGLGGGITKSGLEEMLTNSELPDSRKQRIHELLSYPGYLDKFYIYIAVGGERIPDHRYSFPSPDDFNIYPDDDSDARFVRQKPDLELPWKEPDGAVGFTLRHELFHYDPVNHFQQGVIRSERDADRSAIDSITAATYEFIHKGNSRKYPFVFVSTKGVTITNAPLQSGNILPI